MGINATFCSTLIKYINEKDIILKESEKRRKRDFIEVIKENFLKEVTIDTKPKNLSVSYKLCIDSTPNERYISLELKLGRINFM